MLRLAAIVALTASLLQPASAADPETRYVFVPVAEGALRLDTESGEVSLCAPTGEAPSCTRVSENIRLTLSERTKLEARLEALEERVSALETEAEQARAIDADSMDRVDFLATRMMRHFLGIVRAVKHEVRNQSF